MSPLTRVNRVGVSTPLRSGHVDAHDSLVAVLVGDHSERGRVAVIYDCPTRGDGGDDPLLGHLGRHIDLDMEPLTRGLVLVGSPNQRFGTRPVASRISSLGVPRP